MIREDPAVRSSYVRGRGTETSAEVLVGPPWRMESNAGQQQWYLVLTYWYERLRPDKRTAHVVGFPWEERERLERNNAAPAPAPGRDVGP